jgi:hypothetical protein
MIDPYWFNKAIRPTNPTARPSDFANWVFNSSVPRRRDALQGADQDPENRLERKNGELDHRLIDLTIETKWLQNRIGITTPSDWTKEYVDGSKNPAPLVANKLRVGGIPLQCKPDAVVRNKHDGTVLIIERKTTRRHAHGIPTEGWPNVEAQLWCYSWIDEYVDAPEVLMYGQYWRNGKMLNANFLWKRSDPVHHISCRAWFVRYGGTIAQVGE